MKVDNWIVFLSYLPTSSDAIRYHFVTLFCIPQHMSNCQQTFKQIIKYCSGYHSPVLTNPSNVEKITKFAHICVWKWNGKWRKWSHSTEQYIIICITKFSNVSQHMIYSVSWTESCVLLGWKWVDETPKKRQPYFIQNKYTQAHTYPLLTALLSPWTKLYTC